MEPRDFSTVTAFPGTDSSRYAIAVHAADWVNRLPAPIFLALLVPLAFIDARFDLVAAIGLWLIFLSDWALMWLLPVAGKSYGPAQSPALLLAIFRSFPALLPFPFNWLAQLIGSALVIYGFWIEPLRLTVTHQKLVTPKLGTARPLRVLHLGDLHLERTTERERKLVAMVKSLKPDLILFSGDFLIYSSVEDAVSQEHTREILRHLSAPLGVYAVTGSPPVDKPQVVARLLKGLDIHWLRDERVTIMHEGVPIDIVGITCTHKPFVDAPRLDRLVKDKPDHFTILVYHTPDLAPEAAKLGIDLQVSGHTHGGQVRLPFFGALYTASLYGKHFEAGRYAIGKFTLYVTRGLGMEGKGAPRVRFLCPPEVVLWEISGK